MKEKTEIKVDIQEGIPVIVFEEDSTDSAEKITATGEQIYNYIEKNKPAIIIVNFGKVKFFSSQVLGVLLNIRSVMKEYGAEVVISGINPQLYRVFRITNINKLFRFFENVPAAAREINTNN
jgi:anti-sigma B factor antagonist